MKITAKDREILAHGYESAFWKTFTKVFIEARQMHLAQKAPFLPDMDNILMTRGRIMELNEISTAMEQNHDKQDKKDVNP